MGVRLFRGLARFLKISRKIDFMGARPNEDKTLTLGLRETHK